MRPYPAGIIVEPSGVVARPRASGIGVSVRGGTRTLHSVRCSGYRQRRPIPVGGRAHGFACIIDQFRGLISLSPPSNFRCCDLMAFTISLGDVGLKPASRGSGSTGNSPGTPRRRLVRSPRQSICKPTDPPVNLRTEENLPGTSRSVSGPSQREGLTKQRREPPSQGKANKYLLIYRDQVNIDVTGQEGTLGAYGLSSTPQLDGVQVLAGKVSAARTIRRRP
jgi:hypothetical protein